MATHPEVLLSIVTWNSAATIEQCLASVLALEHPHFAVWVVDNASADDTAERVERLAAHDTRVHLHRLPRNTGFCGGHNYALDHTHSAYVLLVNPDVVLPPDYLSHALRAMQRDERIGTVCGLLVQSPEADPVIDSAGMERLPDGRYRLRCHGQRLSQTPLAAGYVAGADGALPLYRRRFIDDLRVEGRFFDERFFAHKEDWDVAWRGQLYGWRTWLEPACRALHPRVFRPGNLSLRRRLAGTIKTDAVKNQLLLLLKNGPPAREVGFWLRAGLRQAAVLGYSLLLERASLAAYGYVWQQRRAVLGSRRLVQARARHGWQPAPPAPAAHDQPLLSICVPCYHRPDGLARALRSIGPLSPDVEVVVSDNSTRDNLCEIMTHRVLDEQPAIQWRYFRNPPGGSGAGNFNLCLHRARGRYVLHLHDDDYLLPGGLEAMLRTLRRVQGTHEAVLFGVELVDAHRRVLRRQLTSQEEFLPPLPALERVLTDSSMVRIPAIVVTRAAYMEAGCLDEAQGNTGDTDLWARIFAKYGVLRVPECTAAYTVHDGALSANMFTEHTIGQLLRIFSKIEAACLLPPPRLRRAQARFFHQFVLAGTYRALRAGHLPEARQTMELLQLPALRQLPVPLRWAPVRLGFSILTHLDERLARPLLPALPSM